jgi:uncharacterized membrane protein
MDLADKSSSGQTEQINRVDEPYSEQEQEGKSPTEDRFVMLCDGIFAFSITLLVINIKLPNTTAIKSFNYVFDQLFDPILFYVITFVVVAGYWLLHRRMTHILKRLDNRFIALNFAFLAFVAFFPAASGTLIIHAYPTTIILYTLTIAGCGFSALAMWLYAAWHHRLINQIIPLEVIISFSINIAIASIYFCLSLLLLLTPFFQSNPSDLFWTWLALPVLTFLTKRVSRGRLTRWFASLIGGQACSYLC